MMRVTQEDRDRFFELAADHTSYVSAVVGRRAYLVRPRIRTFRQVAVLKGGRSEI